MNQKIELMAKNENEIELSRSEKIARAHPRNEGVAYDRMKMMIESNPDLARSCYYEVPMGGEKRKGPSVRLAEMFASLWGNLRVEYEVTRTDDQYVTAQAVAYDLQSNSEWHTKVQRQIVGNNGKRFPEHLIVKTGAAAAAIAKRNAVFNIIPRTHVDLLAETAMMVVSKSADKSNEQVNRTFDFFSGRGLSEAAVLKLCGVESRDNLTADKIVTLYGVANALKEDTFSVKALTGEPEPSATLSPAQQAKEKANRPRAAKSQPKPKRTEEPAKGPPEESIKDRLRATEFQYNTMDGAKNWTDISTGVFGKVVDFKTRSDTQRVLLCAWYDAEIKKRSGDE